MALAIDATSSGVNITNQTAGGTTTVSHTCTGSNRVLIVSISTWNNGGTGTGCSGVTYNGVAMTAIGNSTGSTGTTTGQFYTEQWRLVAPATGTNNIVATVAGKTDKLGVAAISFTGADQTTGIDVSGKTFGTSGTVTQSVTTTAASEYLVDAVCHLSANNPTSSTGTQILSSATAGTSTAAQYGTAISAGSNALSWTYPDPGDEWAYSVLAVKPDAGTPAVATPTTVVAYQPSFLS